MPANSTDIVNDALARLGISQITSLTDGSKQAQFATRMYDQTRDEVLALRDWTFAVQRATLTRANSTNSEWLYQYALPADFLRLVQLNNDEVGTIKHKFALEGNKIFTDSAALAVVYIGRVTDVTLYSPLFVESLSIKLAGKLAGPLAGDRKMALEFFALFDKVAAMPQPGEQGGRSKRNKDGTLTAVEIANTALAYLGVAPITSLSDNSTQAQLADRFYDVTRDEVLAARPWTFALKRATLAATATGGEWAYSHALPSDFLRAVQINNDEIETIAHKFALEGNAILSNNSTVTLVYVARITTIALYSPLFVEALSLKLAAKFAGPLTAGQQNNNAAATLVASYEKVLMVPQPGEQRKRTNRSKESTISALNIVNAALANIGVSPVASFADGTTQAQAADRLFDMTRDEVLSARPWSFAIKRQNLAAANNLSLTEWSYAFALPSDFIRIVQLNQDEADVIQHRFAIEGRTLYHDKASVALSYVARITDASIYSPAFVEALTLKLAIKFAGSLIQQGQQTNNAVPALTASYDKVIGTPEMGEQRKRSYRSSTNASGEVTVANNALSLIGVSPITSLSDSSASAQLAARFFNPTRDEVLVSHPWNFAIKRAALTQAATPSSQYAYSYTLPADFLRLLQVNGYEVNQGEDDHNIEGSLLLTNASTANIRYVARITDVAQWPALFSEAVSIKLAGKLAGPITQDRNLAASLLQSYETTVLSKGRLTNAFQNRPPKGDLHAASRYVNSRYGEGYGGASGFSGSGGSGGSGSSSTITLADNSSVTSLGSTTARALNARFADTINVLDYGADNTGATDSAASIQAAITAATNNSTIVFPKGTYRMDTRATIPVTKDNITLLGLGATIKAGVATLPQFFRILATNVTVDGLRFDGSYVAGTTTNKTTYAAVTAGGTSSALNSYAIEISGHNCTVQHCRFFDIMGRVIWALAGTGGGGEYGAGTRRIVSGIRVLHNQFTNCYNSVLLNSSWEASLSPIAGGNLQVIGNVITDNSWEQNGSIARAIGIAQFANCPGFSRILISNNILQNAGTTGIELFGDHTFSNVTGNFVEGGDIALSLGGVRHCSVSGNTFIGARDYQFEVATSSFVAATANYCSAQRSNGTYPPASESSWAGGSDPNFMNGLSISGTEILSNLSFSGNVFRDCVTPCFSNATLLDSSFTGNVFASNASANTPAVTIQGGTNRNIVFDSNVITLPKNVTFTLPVRFGASWQSAPANWATATSYSEGTAVTQSGIIYVAATTHTSGVFSTDLSAGKWLVSGSTNLSVNNNIIDGASSLASPIGFTNANLVQALNNGPMSPSLAAMRFSDNFTMSNSVWSNWVKADTAGMSHSVHVSASTATGYAKMRLWNFNRKEGAANGTPSGAGFLFETALQCRAETGMTMSFYFCTGGNDTGGALTERALRVSIVGNNAGHVVTAAIHNGTAETTAVGTIPSANDLQYLWIRWSPLGGTPGAGSALSVYCAGSDGISRLVTQAVLQGGIGSNVFAGNAFSVIANSASTSPGYGINFELGGMKWSPSL